MYVSRHASAPGPLGRCAPVADTQGYAPRPRIKDGCRASPESEGVCARIVQRVMLAAMYGDVLGEAFGIDL